MRSLRAILIGIFLPLMVVGIMAQADFTADVTSGCTPLAVKFTADLSSIDSDTVNYITWDFGVGDTVNSLDPDTVVFLDGGVFTVEMIINGYPGTTVTKTNYITVNQTVQAVFLYEEIGPQTFRFIPLDIITDTDARYFFMWRYDKVDGSDSQFTDYSNISSVDQEIAVDTITLDTGIYNVLLRIEDTYGCLSRYETQVTVEGSEPVQGDFTADVTSGCSPLSVRFNIDESTIDLDTVSFVTWNFGFGDTVNTTAPDTGMSVIYPRGGEYTVTMTVNGYRSSAISKDNYITVYHTLGAAFQSDEFATQTYRFIPLEEITDTAARYNYMWRYEKVDGSDSRSSEYRNISYLNQETAIDTQSLDIDTYMVSLMIEDTLHGCISRFDTRLTVLEELIIYNYFSPRPDNFFEINPQNLSVILRFKVFNRNGILVFQQEAPIINWDGKTSWGKDLVTGVYYYILEATQGDSNGRYSKTGFIHLYQTN